MSRDAFLMLSLPNCTLRTPASTEIGVLALECVTLPPSAKAIYNRDVFLVLRVNSLEVPLDPTRTLLLMESSAGRTYVFYGTETDPTDVTLVVAYSVYHDAALPEDLETFDSILAQYANFQVAGGASEPPSPANEKSGGLPIVPASGLKNEDMRGHLVLMNEDTGEIVGEVDKRITVREDPHLSEKGHENDPVVIEIPDDASPDEETAIEAFARNIPPDQQNWMTTSASLVSHAISGTTNLLVRVISGASNYYISHSQPSPHHSSTNLARSGDASGSSTPPPPPPPRALVFLTSEKTRKNLAKVQTVSTQAAKVSGKTIAIIDDIIYRAINGKEKSSKGKGTTSTLAAPVPQSGTNSGRTSPAPPPYTSQVNLAAGGNNKPPLPPRASGSTVPLNRSNSPNPAPPPPLPPRKLGFKGRIILSADLILSTIDESTKKLINVGADSATAIVQHKYGTEAAQTSTIMGNTARNIGLVYIDVRGVGRKALIKRAGKQYVKSRFSSRHKEAAAQGQAQEKN
ncbi:hypothetical protein Moror_4769 [Moniliophthora roreri MCA 2997]|uniref:Senescence domain-containing protein n=2 Tax=Moniliophthora roreri TaxID=221103 RepID=V2XEV4_MONRO|nr:hypothetical protein Moror_4769 [Moniliophthora roreri MCA 2997]